MRRIQHQRLPFGPKTKGGIGPNIVEQSHRQRRSMGDVDYLKTWGSRPAYKLQRVLERAA